MARLVFLSYHGLGQQKTCSQTQTSGGEYLVSKGKGIEGLHSSEGRMVVGR